MANYNNKDTFTINGNEVTTYRINNDVNGNPRYVIHFLDVANNYNEALNIIRSIGGRKYTAKWFGGGIVFSSYNILEDLKKVIKWKEENYQPLIIRT